MRAKLFGLAEIDPDTEEPDPDEVRLWGMELPEGRAIMYWREGGRNQFAVFGSADRAAQRFGPLFDLGLVWF